MVRTKQTARRSGPISIQTGAQFRTWYHRTNIVNTLLRTAHDTNHEGQQWWKEKRNQPPTSITVRVNQVDAKLVTRDQIQELLKHVPSFWRMRELTITGIDVHASSSSSSHAAALSSSMGQPFSPSSSTSSVHTFIRQSQSHRQFDPLNEENLPTYPDTVVERPKKRQRCIASQLTTKFVPIEEEVLEEHTNTDSKKRRLFEPSAAASSSSSSAFATPSTQFTPQMMKILNLESIRGSVVEEFIRACAAQPDANDMPSLDPVRPVAKLQSGPTMTDATSMSEHTPFIVVLLQTHRELDGSQLLEPASYQPYRNQLKSLIRRAPTELTLKYGTVTPNCTLLQYVIYTWPINNTEHVAYDWLCGLLETPNYPINAIDCHGESALSSWSRDEYVVNGLVFHKLVQAGARTDRLDKYDRSWMFHLLDLGQYNLIRSLIRHGYEHLCLDAFMQSSRESEFLNPHDSVWADRLDDEEKEYESMEQVLEQDRMETAMRELPEEYDDDDQDLEERLNQYRDEGPERVMVEMRRTWMKKYHPHILDLLTSPPQYDGCGIITDCAQLCLQYLDGSGRSWLGTEQKESHSGMCM